MEISLISLIKDIDVIDIKQSEDIHEIEKALYETLYVPDTRLKPRIIETILEYLSLKIGADDYHIAPFIAYHEKEICGFVISTIHPTYTSYGKKCGTFGWLNASSFEVCRSLIKQCEIFTRKHGLRKIRGNVNFPKGLGGLGIQVSGFDQQMMYGVAFNDPQMDLVSYLEHLGYKKESEYTCMKVTEEFWKSGAKIDSQIKYRYLTLDEMRDHIEQLFELVQNSFQMNFPDASGGKYRINEMIDTYAQVPKSHYILPNNFDPKTYSNIPEFVEAWEGCNLEEVVTWAPWAFDRNTNELVGIILSLPDLYESWLGNHITRNNVDTAMVRKDYAGRGIFSALNNIGQLTCKLFGMKYCEGTTIWYNNQDAVNSIFPHCEHIRKHYVMQKRIKKSLE